MVGGAVSTTEIVPGYRFDLGGSAHILIRLTPVVEELELETHGLEYLEVDPSSSSPTADGPPLLPPRRGAHRGGIEARFPGEGEAYRSASSTTGPPSRTVKEAFLSVPSPWELGKRFVFNRSGGAWKTMLQRILRPYGEIVDEYFRRRD
jgi:phytoene dehydrogenase-like protein